MKDSKEKNPVQDYWKFVKELRSQMNLVKLLERQFFEIDGLCEWALRNEVTVLDDKTGERVSVVDDCLNREQSEVYEKMRIEVGKLFVMLSNGRSCFGIEGD